MQQAIKPVTTVLNENYKNQLSTNEYQLILSPHEELCSRIWQIKTAFSEAYQTPSGESKSSRGGGAKPNLTILRFTQLALMEERIVQRLRTIAMGYCPFKVELKDFGSLPTHSIFIQVTSKLPIRALVKEIRDLQRLMKLDKDHKPYFVEEPNLLIARNLLPRLDKTRRGIIAARINSIPARHADDHQSSGQRKSCPAGFGRLNRHADRWGATKSVRRFRRLRRRRGWRRSGR